MATQSQLVSMVGNGPWHCLVIRTDVAEMSIEWLERGRLGLFAGGLSYGMPQVVDARSGGYEGKAWACAGIGSCRKLAYAAFCASVTWHVGWHTCRLGGIAKACGDERQNVIFHPFLGTCPTLT